MYHKKRKLISLGGQHSSRRWVISTQSGQRWVLNSKPINWAKISGYGIVIAFIFAIMAFLIAYASESHDDDVTTQVTKIIAIQTSKPMIEAFNLQKPKIIASTMINVQCKTEKNISPRNDLVIELSSMKNQKKEILQAQVEDKQKEELVAKTKVAAAENLSYVTVFSADTEERIRTAMEIIVGNGFTPEAAAAIVGNALVESQLKPEAQNGSYYFGIFQWSVSWWENIKSWLLDNGHDIYSFEGQIRAAIECPYYGCMSESRWGTLKGLTNIDQATELFAVFYEGCIGGSDPTEYYSVGTCYQGLKLRKSEARQALLVYQGEGYSGSKPYYP